MLLLLECIQCEHEVNGGFTRPAQNCEQPVKILFCSDPLSPGEPDSCWLDEVQAAERAGLGWALLDFEELRVRRAPREELLIYRGWMLPSARYAELCAQGWRLINDAQAYRCCHEFPASYPLIEPYTPRSVWTEGPEIPEGLLAPFGSRSLVVKDYVKSRKHEWDQACFIPTPADVPRVVARFLELQGPDFQGGLVFREYVELDRARETRLFFLDGELIWGEPREPFVTLARSVPSRFFSMDIAPLGERWIIVELGDGQVAGLPDDVDRDAFYRALLAASD